MSVNRDCLFCKIVDGRIPSDKIYEDENVIAFKDISPMAPVHYLFIPKKHYSSLAHVPVDEAGVMADIFKAIIKVTNEKGIADDGYRSAINTGLRGGQSVFHLHVHVMAGKQMSEKMT